MSPSEHQEIGLVHGYELSRKLYAISLELLKESDFMAVQSSRSRSQRPRTHADAF